jgi:hypothetical protein
MKKKKSVRKPAQKLLPAPKGSDVGKHKIMKLPKGAHVEIEPTALIMAAITHKTDMNMIKDLMDLRDRINRERAEKEYNLAMAKFQSECPVVPTKRVGGGKVNYKYARIDDIVATKDKNGVTIAELIGRNGFSYTTTVKILREKEEWMLEGTVHITHSGGHSKDSPFSIPIMKSEYISEQQTFAVANTFAMRYAFKNGFGIITGDLDTDGKPPSNSGTDKKNKKGKPEVDDGQDKQKDALDKINALSDYVKEGLKHCGYTKLKVVYSFCDKFGWDEKKIMLEINKIEAAREGSK